MMLLPDGNAQENWSPKHVFYGKGGKLTYTPDELGNTIPDFSNVGYRYGDFPIPEIATVVEVSPVDGDDGATIQAAINSLFNMEPDENGFRGAVLLKAGVYQVSGQIKIAASGIVLRGEGESDNGTVIIAEGTSDRDLIKVDNGASRNVISTTRAAIAEDYVPVGRKYVVVLDASGYAEGDRIVLYRQGTSQWISDIKMNQLTPTEGTVQWSASGYSFYFERLVTRVNGDTIFFRNPVVMAMEKRYGRGTVYKYTFNRLQNIGIENICLKSAYTSETDEEHSWSAIGIYSAENCWVRNVTAWYFALSCVKLESNSRLTTVLNCHSKEQKSIITGGRRYPFQTSGSLNLFKNCTTTEARHDYATGARVCGPNVFTGSTAVNSHSDIGPHHRWAMGTLFDVIVTNNQINVQDRDDMGTGHGWSGANQVFWNCMAASSICQSPWTSAKNYNFGFIGRKETGYRSGRPDGEWVGHSVPGIFPVSLYEAQLNERLNGTRVFSAISPLIQINDTAYLMNFSLPLNSEQIKIENFLVTGSDEVENASCLVKQYDDYSVLITSAAFKNLPDLTTIKVKSGNLTSKDSLYIQGVTSATYTLESKIPIVNGMAKVASNVNGFGEASSNATGYIYLVKYGVHATSQSVLDSLVSLNMGRKAAISVAGDTVQVSAKGVFGGYYEYYAVDMEGRVSTPSAAWVIVEEKGPVTGVEMNSVKDNFSAFQREQQIIVNPGNTSGYSLEIYTTTGQQVYRGNKLLGIQSINLNGIEGILFIRKISGQNKSVIKIVATSIY